MSKIVCDVCGTYYPETAAQCPICGCIRPSEAKSVAGDTQAEVQAPVSTYTYVKGGRFSKKNVRARNREAGLETPKKPAPAQEPKEPKKEKSDKGLIIAVVALLLAIIAVVIYIVLRVFGPVLLPNNDNTENSNATNTTSTQDTVLEVPCTDIVITPDVIELAREGASWLLNVELLPEDTTDTGLTYASEDETIATVTDSGKVTAVAPGETYITVTCGNVTQKCLVQCTFAPDETEPVTYPMDDFEFDAQYNKDQKKYDVTLNTDGQMHVLYAGDIPADVITWTSDKESVVTFVDGVITAVGYGTTEVHAEYNGTKLTCIVRSYAKSNGGSVQTGTGGVTEDGADDQDPVGPYTLSHNDVTIKVGDKFVLELEDANNKVINVTWTSSNASCSINGNTITGVSRGTATVSTIYEGEEYTCIVRTIGG